MQQKHSQQQDRSERDNRNIFGGSSRRDVCNSKDTSNSRKSAIVLRIRDSLVRIRMRIWILGSVPLTNGSDADPGGPKTYGSGTLVHLHHSSKIKSHKEVTKHKKSRFLLPFLVDDGRIRSRICTCY
jgi:hypothetical protein